MNTETVSHDLGLFISAIRNTDSSIEKIYTNGGCYGFAKFIHELYPESELYVRLKENQYHVIIKYKGNFFDITGEVKDTNEYFLLKKNTIEKFDMENWDSAKNLNITNKIMYGELQLKNFENNTKLKRSSQAAAATQIGSIIITLLMLHMIVTFTASILASQLGFFYNILKIESYNITVCIFLVSFAVFFSWKLLENILFKFNTIIKSLTTKKDR